MSFTMFSNDARTARKPHVCIWCGELIAPGFTYFDERSVYDGTVQRHRWHPECQAASREYSRESGEDEFDPYDNNRPPALAAKGATL